MQSPTLNDLPPPPPGKTGWPWTEESRRLPDRKPDGSLWTAISVVTPSFNQALFLEETLRSVLLQGYPNLEYLVLDGGSTDESVAIIRKYAPWLRYWTSQPDGGQSDAINRGLKKASGEFATWINSDDLLCKDALVDQVTRFGCRPATVYVGHCLYIDEMSCVISSHRGRVHSLEDLLRIRTVWRARGCIDQPAALFPRALALAVGGLEPNNHLSMDYELWGQFFLAGAKFQYTDVPFGMFRTHRNQKTYDGLKTTQSLLNAAAKLARAANLTHDARAEIMADLESYREQYQRDDWRGSGRLAAIGLPPVLVNPLRKARALWQRCAR